MGDARNSVLTIFGTRPEVIKLAPVLDALDRHGGIRTINVATSQHRELARPFQSIFAVRDDHDLGALAPGQPLNQLCARILERLDPILEQERPDLVLVQGDTTSALAGALAATHRRIPVGHVEAGLRTHDPKSPFPEELNRQTITRLTTYHFAATHGNVATLLHEGVPAERIALTGNPVVDALHRVLRTAASQTLVELLDRHHGRRLIVLTTHRRESLGERMRANLEVLRRHVEANPDLALIFPVHPNPAVRSVAEEVLKGAPRVELLSPLDYPDFVHLMSRAWLLVSDSGGVQEEAPTLRRPLLVLRDTTERPEAIACGVAKLVGGSPERLASLLDEAGRDETWFERVRQCRNPFGEGDSGERIVAAIEHFLAIAQEGAPTLAAAQ